MGRFPGDKRSREGHQGSGRRRGPSFCARFRSLRESFLDLRGACLTRHLDVFRALLTSRQSNTFAPAGRSWSLAYPERPQLTHLSSGRWSKVSAFWGPTLGAHPLSLSPRPPSAWVDCIRYGPRNRQDAREALEIAALGKVKCHLEIKALAALSEYVGFSSFLELCGR